jgi:ABC-type branched-subunit amino acid transport system substrate-binding protein
MRKNQVAFYTGILIIIGVVIATLAGFFLLRAKKEESIKIGAIISLSGYEAKAILDILRELNIKNLGVLYQNDAFGTSVFEVLKEKFEKTGGIVRSEAFQTDAPDFAPKIAKLWDTEAIYTVGFVENDEQAIRQLRDSHYKGVILAHSGATSLPRTTPELNSVYVTAPIIYNPNYLFAQEVKKNMRTTMVSFLLIRPQMAMMS